MKNRLLALSVLLFVFVSGLAHAGMVRHEVKFENPALPLVLEIGEHDGFIRILTGHEGEVPRLLFEGKVQGLSFPLIGDKNTELMKALFAAKIGTFETVSVRSPNLLVVMSNSALLAYDATTNGEIVRAEIPREPNINVRAMSMMELYFDWVKSDTVIYSFKYAVPSPENGTELYRMGTYAYQPPLKPGQLEVTQLSPEFTKTITLSQTSLETVVSYRLPSKSEHNQVRIPSREAGEQKATSTALAVVPKAEKRVATPTAYRNYISEFSKSLNHQVLGQPEAVDILLDIEKQNILNQNIRSVPEIAMFIGLPGTGKDTLVESYFRARMLVARGTPDEPMDQHIFRTPKVKKESDAWSLTGSGTGYVGSGKISALNRFLVQHSGGRYKIEKTQGSNPEEYIVENSAWRKGQVLDNYSAPQDGILFINELHDWSQEMKNVLLKEALEKGSFVVGNPGAGVNRIEVPITIVLASNDGIGLITARDREGKRVGQPLTEVQMLERWKLAAPDKATLKSEMAQSTPSNPDGGTSEEFLSRIPNSRLILLRPLPQSTVVKITRAKLLDVREKFASTKSMGFPSVTLQFSGKLEKFIATYDQLAEDGARPVKDKVESLVEKTITDAAFSGELTFQNRETLNVSVRRNNDATYSLVVNGRPLLIQQTLKDRDSLPIDDKQIDKLVGLEGELNKRVKGVEHIAAALARDIRYSSNQEKADHVEKETKTADVYAFLGTSSTGKTELATALHQVLFETDSKPLVIDFGQIQHAHQLKEKILGFRDQRNKAVPSDFMGAYDRANGKLVVVLDEVSNANPEVLKGLYDILREPVVRTFSDGKSRAMGQVRIVMTGNAGEEWYEGIPREAPEAQQLESAREIYEKAIANEGYLRKFLTTKFSEAFLNRVGLHRVFFFAPHTAKNTRELVQLKLVKEMKEFNADKPGRRSWNVNFASHDDYRRTVESIENYGFKLWEQGASITNFVSQSLVRTIHDRLLTEKIPAGSEVFIRKTEDKVAKDGTMVGFELLTSGGDKRFLVEVKGKVIPKPVRRNQKDSILTAFHEAGHEVVNKVLFRDKMKSGGVSVLPGVSEIGGRWIMYEGLARRELVESLTYTRETVLSQLAVLLGGEAAEQLVTKNARHSAGVSDDIERATALARRAILSWGLSDKWGRTSADAKSTDAFINGLSESRRRILEKEVQSFMEQGRALARSVLISNYDNVFMSVGVHLAKKGEVGGEALEKFYEKRGNEIVYPEQKDVVKQKMAEFEVRKKAEAPPTNPRELEFYSFVKMPVTVADPEAIRLARRAKELASVDLSPGFALVKTPVAKPVVAAGGRCELLFK